MDGLLNFVGGPWGAVMLIGTLAVLLVLVYVMNRVSTKANARRKTMKEKASFKAKDGK